MAQPSSLPEGEVAEPRQRESAPAQETRSAAPDVDLRSRGLQLPMLLGIAAVALAFYMRSRSSASDVLDSRELAEEAAPLGEAQASALWPLWLLLWCVLRLCQLLLCIVLVLLAGLVARQRQIIYVPVPPNLERSPKDNLPQHRSPEQAYGLPYEDLMITTEDGVRINAWFLTQPLENCTESVPFTLVYFHGNAGNIGHRLENLRDMYQKLKVNILIVDYRGYGDSEDGGGPCEKGFLLDAMAAYKWLVERCRTTPQPATTKMSADRILLFGRSIGGAVCARLMENLLREQLRGSPDALPLPAGLVLENAFASLREMAVQIFPFLSFFGPVLRQPLLFDEWKASESLEFVAKRSSDWCLCLLSGLQDEIVPPAQMRALHRIAAAHNLQGLDFFTFEYGGHNDTPMAGGAYYWQSFNSFLKKVADTEDKRIAARKVC